ncbi:uncharacterized protein ACIBXB_015150 [Morphnus guianensis]
MPADWPRGGTGLGDWSPRVFSGSRLEAKGGGEERIPLEEAGVGRAPPTGGAAALRACRPAGSLPGAGGAAPLPRHVGRAVASRRKGGAGPGRREHLFVHKLLIRCPRLPIEAIKMVEMCQTVSGTRTRKGTAAGSAPLCGKTSCVSEGRTARRALPRPEYPVNIPSLLASHRADLVGLPRRFPVLPNSACHPGGACLQQGQIPALSQLPATPGALIAMNSGRADGPGASAESLPEAASTQAGGICRQPGLRSNRGCLLGAEQV